MSEIFSITFLHRMVEGLYNDRAEKCKIIFLKVAYFLFTVINNVFNTT